MAGLACLPLASVLGLMVRGGVTQGKRTFPSCLSSLCTRGILSPLCYNCEDLGQLGAFTARL